MSESRRIEHLFQRIIICVAIVVCVFAIASLVFMAIFFTLYFDRNDLAPDSIELTYDDVDAAMYPRETISFFSGENQLQAYIYGRENGENRGLIVMAHGIDSGADSHLPETMFFVDHGWVVFAFDGTGTRSSQGAGINGLAQTRIDLSAALDYIEDDKDLDELPVVLYGHSMGGYAAAAALADQHDVCAAVCVSAFNSPVDTMCYQVGNVAGVLGVIERPFIWLQNRLTFGEFADSTAIEGINVANIPVLVVYGMEDNVVPYDTIGIYAYRNDIANDQVRFLAVNEPYRDEHSTIWLTENAARYSLQKWDEWDNLHQVYGEDIPMDIWVEFISGIDKEAMNEVDETFMKELDDFYSVAVSIRCESEVGGLE